MFTLILLVGLFAVAIWRGVAFLGMPRYYPASVEWAYYRKGYSPKVVSHRPIWWFPGIQQIVRVPLTPQEFTVSLDPRWRFVVLGPGNVRMMHPNVYARFVVSVDRNPVAIQLAAERVFSGWGESYRCPVPFLHFMTRGDARIPFREIIENKIEYLKHFCRDSSPYHGDCFCVPFKVALAKALQNVGYEVTPADRELVDQTIGEKIGPTLQSYGLVLEGVKFLG